MGQQMAECFAMKPCAQASDAAESTELAACFRDAQIVRVWSATNEGVWLSVMESLLRTSCGRRRVWPLTIVMRKGPVFNSRGSVLGEIASATLPTVCSRGTGVNRNIRSYCLRRESDRQVGARDRSRLSDQSTEEVREKAENFIC
jgi:hypothetical protein